MGNEKPKPGTRSVSIKAGLVDEIEDFIKESNRYRSLAEFFAEAARLRLEELEKKKGAVHSER